MHPTPCPSRASRGASLTEYGIVVGLIALVAIGAVALLGERTSRTLGTVEMALADAMTEVVGGCLVAGVGSKCENGSYYAGDLEGQPIFMIPDDEDEDLIEVSFSVTPIFDGADSRTDGLYNTRIITSNGRGDAADWCRAGGKTDYTPAVDEMAAMIANNDSLPASQRFKDVYYWSSTEIDDDTAYAIHGTTGDIIQQDKSVAYGLRCAKRPF